MKRYEGVGKETRKALENFPKTFESFDIEFLRCYGLIKKAAAHLNNRLGYLSPEYEKAISKACDELIEGKLIEKIVVDPLSGGAGTSINMNINEVIAIRANELADLEEEKISSLEHVNLHQSTNDTFATAGKMAVMIRLEELVEAADNLQIKLQAKEREFETVRKPGRTQLMDAVPITLGQEFGAMAEAISRDRWRLNKVRERIRLVNLGGTAIGTGVSTSRKYVLSIVETLRKLSGIGIVKAENLIEATQNSDAFAEVHGLLKTMAVNLMKISNDIRLLGSGPGAGIGELVLPCVQTGSTIMPGKVNPVVPEYVIQLSMVVLGHDVIINQACSWGNLELNAFTPVIVHYILKSLTFLTDAASALAGYILKIQANEERALSNLMNSDSALTPAISSYGYEAVQKWMKTARREKRSVWEVAGEILKEDPDKLHARLLSESVTGLGFNE